MALLTYTLLRVALVVGAGALLYLLGVRNWLLVVLAVVIGAGLSYVLLHGPRHAAASDLEQRAGGRRTRMELSVERDGAEEDAQFDIDPQEYASVVDDDGADPLDGADPQDDAEHAAGPGEQGPSAAQRSGTGDDDGATAGAGR